MILDRNENKEVVVLLGAGSMGTAIVRRIAAGKKILLGDLSRKALERVSREFTYSGYDVETQIVDACDEQSIRAFAAKAASMGPVMTLYPHGGRVSQSGKPRTYHQARPHRLQPDRVYAPRAHQPGRGSSRHDTDGPACFASLALTAPRRPILARPTSFPSG